VHNPKLAKVIGPLGAHFRTGYWREREIAVNIILRLALCGGRLGGPPRRATSSPP